MNDLRYLTRNFPEASAQLARRGFTLSPEVCELDAQRRQIATAISEMRASAKKDSNAIGQLRSGGAPEAVIAAHQEAARQQREAIAQREEQQRAVGEALNSLLLGIPNIPAARVPAGASDKDNVELRRWEPSRTHGSGTRDHLEIGRHLGIIDTETASKIAGPRFAILRGKGPVLQRAIGTYMLDRHTANGYQEVTVPYMVNSASMQGTGQLPKFENDLFKTGVGGKPLYLSPTAEVQMTNMHADTVVPENTLTTKYTTLSENFRSEAGSGGRDVRGIFRQHQFPKVELVQITKPEDSDQEWNGLVSDAEGVLQGLDLSYRVMDICTGDLSFGASYSNDLEVWLPGQNQYREISSCSNFTDFQARRMNAKFRREETAQTEFVHTLNGSGLAVGRTIVAILEQYQQPDGSVVIPEPLQDYTKFSAITP
jgi:seryl-tRNA synthetase